MHTVHKKTLRFMLSGVVIIGIQEMKLFEIPLLNHPKLKVFVKCMT